MKQDFDELLISKPPDLTEYYNYYNPLRLDVESPASSTELNEAIVKGRTRASSYCPPPRAFRTETAKSNSSPNNLYHDCHRETIKDKVTHDVSQITYGARETEPSNRSTTFNFPQSSPRHNLGNVTSEQSHLTRTPTEATAAPHPTQPATNQPPPIRHRQHTSLQLPQHPPTTINTSTKRYRTQMITRQFIILTMVKLFSHVKIQITLF